MRRCFSMAVLLAAIFLSAGGAALARQRVPAPVRPLDVIYVPTPPDVVARMLTIAGVGAGDVVYDLGSGDGRIVITAVKDFGAARGVGIELDPQRISESVENARIVGVSDRVTFLAQDLFEADLSEATVVAMYLLPAILTRLQPRLRALRPGTRIVSHNYDMGTAWKPTRTVRRTGSLVHLWRVPRR